MSAPFTIERRVEFSETDAAGIVHFSNYFRYMEAVEHAFLRHLGTSVAVPCDDGSTLSWPRVSASCDYRQPMRFEDVVELQLRISRLGKSSVTYGVQFVSRGQPQPALLAIGEMTAVCCRIRPHHRPQPEPIPDNLRSLFEAYHLPPDAP